MNRTLGARMAAHESWARTPDRAARTAPAFRAGPQCIEWHLQRLPLELANCSERDRLAAAESARKAYFSRLAFKSAQARKRGAA